MKNMEPLRSVENINPLRSNPGAVQHGNYINYYTFNTVESRMATIRNVPENIWNFKNNPYLVLDIGCNSGDLTQKLYELLKEKGNGVTIIILGIDIDNGLIKRAKDNAGANGNLIYECIDIMNTDQFNLLDNFLKIYNRSEFDAIFCLAVTMWIHLNHSDEGLKKFLKTISEKSDLLIMELQPWKSYNKAVQRMKKANKPAFERFAQLTWRKNVQIEINNYLQECNKKKIKEADPTEWHRQLLFYN